MIALIDYGMGNLKSVENALKYLNVEFIVTSVPRDIHTARQIILPGVGAFGDAMKELQQRGLIDPLKEAISAKKPLLGICLGLQLLFSGSEESPGVDGLAVFDGIIKKFAAGTALKIPHMGWNSLSLKRPECPLLNEVRDGSYCYFVHSYYADCAGSDISLAETEYGCLFSSMLWQENVYASQFHPEKSQKWGLRILKNFVSLN